MIETWLLKAFDGLEMVRSTDIRMDAPKHFHNGYAIGIALSGLQTIQLQHDSYIVAPGAFMFLDPHEIHAHKAFEEIAWSHRMLYVSPDYIRWLQKLHMIHVQEELHFNLPLAHDATLYELFNCSHSLLTDRNDGLIDEQNFVHCIAAIFNRYTSGKQRPREGAMTDMMLDIQDYIAANINQTLNLDKLANRFHLNKFKLIRSFKQYKGITPNEYLTIIRVEKAKHFIMEGMPLTSAGLEVGFYDQSHFSHYFLKYTNFTPGQFKNKLIHK